MCAPYRHVSNVESIESLHMTCAVDLKRQPNMSPIYTILLARYVHRCITTIRSKHTIDHNRIQTTISKYGSTKLTVAPPKPPVSVYTYFDHHTPHSRHVLIMRTVWVYGNMDEWRQRYDTLCGFHCHRECRLYVLHLPYRRKYAVHELHIYIDRYWR